jgi:hypothetical protein
MIEYVIVRDDGVYVSLPGSEHSYTRKLQHARVWSSRESAERERCPGNEHVEAIESQFARS